MRITFSYCADKAIWKFPLIPPPDFPNQTNAVLAPICAALMKTKHFIHPRTHAYRSLDSDVAAPHVTGDPATRAHRTQTTPDVCTTSPLCRERPLALVLM